MSGLTRRTFLEVLAFTSVAVQLPGCGTAMMMLPPELGFFTEDERSLLGKLCDYVLPPDDAPGAAGLGAVAYIEGLLSAFDSSPPRLYAGGPFSGRQPYIDPTLGTASRSFPDNAFATWLPLSRVAEAGWRLRLYGSAGVSGGGPNDALLGAVVGWRELFKQGLADALKTAGKPPSELSADEVEAAWNKLGAPLKDVLVNLTLEGVFGAPEYGGNKGGEGWKLAHYEGDSQPLGYSQFDESAKIYRERPEAPLSTKNPGPDPHPLTSETTSVLEIVTRALGGRVSP